MAATSVRRALMPTPRWASDFVRVLPCAIAGRSRDRPAIELGARGVGIRSEQANAVLAQVLEHVDERMTHLPRIEKHALVEAVAEDGAVALPEAIQLARDAREQGAHAVARGRAIGRFDDQVQVVGLDRVVHDLKRRSSSAARGGAAIRARDRGADARRLRWTPDARQSGPQARCDEQREARLVRRTRVVGEHRALSLGLSARTRARSAPGAELQLG